MEKNEKFTLFQTTGKLLLCFCITLITLFLVFIAATAIPKYKIRENLLASAKYLLEEEALFHQLREGDRRTEIHNYADATTLNILYSIDGKDRVKEILISPFYSKKATLEQPVTELLLDRIMYERQADTLYDRYWHGMILVLRPLFLIATLQQIRWIFLGVLLGSMLVLSVLLLRKKQKQACILLWLGALTVQLPVVAFCAEYVPVFFITFWISIAMVLLEKRRERILSLCVVSGVCVAFFDFLTTETLAFVIPLALVYCIWDYNGRLKGIKEEFYYFITAGICWAGAYAGTYLVKWGLSGLVYGEERFSAALAQFAGRQGNEAVSFAIDSLGQNGIPEMAIKNAGGDILPQFLSAVVINIRLMMGLSGEISLEKLALLLSFLVFIFVVIAYLFRKPGKTGTLPKVLCLLGIVPMLRMMVLNNHSIEHCFFVYRGLYGTIFCMLAGLVNMFNWGLLQRRRRL